MWSKTNFYGLPHSLWLGQFYNFEVILQNWLSLLSSDQGSLKIQRSRKNAGYFLQTSQYVNEKQFKQNNHFNVWFIYYIVHCKIHTLTLKILKLKGPLKFIHSLRSSWVAWAWQIENVVKDKCLWFASFIVIGSVLQFWGNFARLTFNLVFR